MKPPDDLRIPGAEIRAVREWWAEPRDEFALHFAVCSSTVYAWERDGVTPRNQKFDPCIFLWLKLPMNLPPAGAYD